MSSQNTSTSSINKEDQQLLALLLENDEKGLKLIFERYYKYLVVTAYKMLNDNHKARDLVQDVFFRFWEKRETLNIQISLKAYLRRAVVNRVLDDIRKRKRHIWDEQVVETQQMSENVTVLDHLETNDLQQVIDQAIASLPERCRVVFSLSRFENMSHKEIAQGLSISTKTIESQITKALKVLRAAVEAYNAVFIATINLLWLM